MGLDLPRGFSFTAPHIDPHGPPGGGPQWHRLPPPPLPLPLDTTTMTLLSKDKPPRQQQVKQVENWAEAADIWSAAAAAATCAACGCKGPTEPKAFHRRPQPLTVTQILLASVLNTQENLLKITESTTLSSLGGRRQGEGEPSCPFCDILGSQTDNNQQKASNLNDACL